MQGWKMRQQAALQRRAAANEEREEIRRARAEHYRSLADGGTGPSNEPAPEPKPVTEAPLDVPPETVIVPGEPDTGEFVEEGEDDGEPEGGDAVEKGATAPNGPVPPDSSDASVFEMSDDDLRAKLAAAGVAVDGRWKRTRLVSELRTRGLLG